MASNLVYVAHPYAGKEENRKKIDQIMMRLVEKDKQTAYVSPIHNFGFMYMDGEYYIEGLDYCLTMLNECRAIILCGDYATSRGCCAEYGFAKGARKSVYTLAEWEQLLAERGDGNEQES